MKSKTSSKPTLKDLVEAAQKEGAKVSVGLTEKRPQMPSRFPDDHPNVVALVEESERLNAMGCKWMDAEKPNPVAADLCFKAGWAHALSAAWLRCKLKGEVGK